MIKHFLIKMTCRVTGRVYMKDFHTAVVIVTLLMVGILFTGIAENQAMTQVWFTRLKNEQFCPIEKTHFLLH